MPRGDQAPDGVPEALHDAPPTHRLVWVAVRRTDAETCDELASVTGTHRCNIARAARELHERDALAPRNPDALGHGRPAVEWSAQHPCSECGKWFSVNGLKQHQRYAHDEGPPSPSDLADADPEDLGLSPIDERDVPGRIER